MASPDIRTQQQLKTDLSRRPMWYGVVCGNTEGRFLEDRMDFLAHTGGFVEAIQLIEEFPLTNETLPEGYAFYIPPIDITKIFDDTFGEERQIVRVMSVKEALRSPYIPLVVMPCNSQRWHEKAKQTPPWDY